MDVHNLAVCFAPNLFAQTKCASSSSGDAKSQCATSTQQCNVIKDLIEIAADIGMSAFRAENCCVSNACDFPVKRRTYHEIRQCLLSGR